MSGNNMTFQEFCKGMKKHFKITHGIQGFVSSLFALRPETGIMSITKFDDWLHEKWGEYEKKRGFSMEDLVITEYGEGANIFLRKALNI